MASTKEQTVENVEPSTEASATIMTTTTLAARYEAYQHSLTRGQAIKENKKPIMWCKSPTLLFSPIDHRAIWLMFVVYGRFLHVHALRDLRLRLPCGWCCHGYC